MYIALDGAARLCRFHSVVEKEQRFFSNEFRLYSQADEANIGGYGVSP